MQANITLRNPKLQSAEAYETFALVDTGALHLCIPEHVALQLELKELQKREVTSVDRKQHISPYVGPLEVSLWKRSCFTGAVVFGNEVLLGAIPMEDIDVVTAPAARTIIPNPKNLNIPAAVVK